MATFTMNKTRDDIEEPEAMPEDWYEFEIAKEPTLVPNKALREMVGENADEEEMNAAMEMNEKAGRNLVVKLKSISSDPAFNGRVLTSWIPYPSDFDEDRFDARGQKTYDAKMVRVVEFTEAFGGDVDGEAITLLPGLKGQCYVTIGTNDRGEKTNSIDLFSGFKPSNEA